MAILKNEHVNKNMKAAILYIVFWEQALLNNSAESKIVMHTTEPLKPLKQLVPLTSDALYVLLKMNPVQ